MPENFVRYTGTEEKDEGVRGGGLEQEMQTFFEEMGKFVKCDLGAMSTKNIYEVEGAAEEEMNDIERIFATAKQIRCVKGCRI